jgi:hypothetical protein
LMRLILLDVNVVPDTPEVTMSENKQSTRFW